MADLRVDLIPGVNQGALTASSRIIAARLREGAKEGSRGFEAEMRRIGRIVDTARIGAAARRQFSEFGRAAEDAGKRARKAAEDVGKGFEQSSEFAEELLKDVKAIQDVISSQRNKKNSLLDPRSFAELNRVLEKLQGFQRRVRITDPNDFTAMRKLRLEFEGLASEATKAKTQFRASVDEAIAGARLQSNTEARLARERLVARQTEASQTRFLSQRQQQEILSNTQRTNAIRVQVTRTFLETIGRLERGLGATIAGVARTATGAVSRIYSDTLGRISSMFTRTGRQISQIERSNSSSRFGIFRSSLSQQERLLQQSVTRQSQIIQRAQQQANTGILGATRRSSLLGLGGGLAGFGLLSLGVERFSNLERLQRQFEALTGSAEQTQDLLAQISKFARETPFDLIGVADLAKGFLAIKTPADQVLTRVRAIADAVAFTGGGTVELTRIQRALGQIISAGKLQGDEINQLAESLPGLNIRQVAADLFGGGSFARFQELNDAGEISGEQFVEGFINALLFDPRIVGASEDLAKTLGGRLANLKEVVGDVGSAFIGLIAEPLKQGTVIATRALDGLAQFISGNVTGAFALLRTAVGGAAIAIGGLLVAKTAAEALKVLATSARLLLTPFGLLVTVVGAIGAAFAIMRTRSEEFRDVTDRLGRLLGTQFSNIVTAVGEAVDKVRAAFTEARAPIVGTADALERAAQPARTWISEIGSRLGTAIGVASRFLTGTLIPALANVAIFIGQRIGPAFRFLREQFISFANFVAPAVNRGLELIGRGFDFVIARGREVIEALREIASGARSALGPGLAIGGAALAGTVVAGPVGAVVASVAAAFATLSPQIRQSIVEGVTTAKDRVIAIFRGIDWEGIAQGALRFVNRVGFILGNIVTDRRFVAALLGIAAVAAAVAVNFVSGFARGVLDNAGDLTDLGKDIGAAILRGLFEFFSNPTNLALSAALGAAFFAGRGVFRIGQQVAGEFSGGLQAGFRDTTRAGGSFLTGLFGGPGALAADARKTAVKAQAAIQTEFRRIDSALRASGGTGVVAVGGLVRPETLNAARGSLQRLEERIGATGLAALRLRGAFSDAFAGIRASGGNVAQIFSSLKTGVGDAAAALRGQGKAIGSALGVGVLAGFGSIVGGQQLGSGNTAAGLGGILASAVGAGLATGNVGVGAVVGGIGLIAAAVTSLGQKSRNTAAAVETVRESLRGLTNLGGSAAASVVQGTISDQFAEEADATRQAFVDIGLTAENLAEEFIRLGGTGTVAVGELRDAFDDLRNTADDATFEARFGKAQEAIDKIAVSSPFLAERLRNLFAEFQKGNISQKTFKEALDEIFDTTQETGRALVKAGIDAQVFGTKIDGAADAVNRFNISGSIQSALANAVDAAKGKADEAKNAFEDAKTAADAFLNPNAGTITEQTNAAILSLGGIGTGISEGFATGGLLGGAQIQTQLDNLGGAIADIVKTGIDTGASEADVDAALGTLALAVDELDVDPGVAGLLKTKIEEAISAVTIPVDVEAQTDAATRAGRDVAVAAANGFRATNPGSAGGNFATAIAIGIRAKIAVMQAAARAAANAALASVNSVFRISSPSKAGLEIGANFGNAMAQGIAQSSTEIAFAAQEAAKAATATASEVMSKKTNLFGEIFAGDAALDEAKIRINAGLGAILSPIQQANERAASAAARAAAPGATAEDIAEAAAAAAAAANRSIALDLNGINNRSVISDAVENIKNLGRLMLEAGSSTASIAETMSRTRTDLINFATALGFSNAEIIALIDSLGLSEAAIQRFARETDRVKPDIPDPGTGDSGGDTNITFEAGSVSLALPFGDPTAVALAVGNRIATTVRV